VSATQIHRSSLAATPPTKTIPMLIAARLSYVLAEASVAHICKASGPLSPLPARVPSSMQQLECDPRSESAKKTPLAGSKEAQLSTFLKDLEMLISLAAKAIT